MKKLTEIIVTLLTITMLVSLLPQKVVAREVAEKPAFNFAEENIDGSSEDEDIKELIWEMLGENKYTNKAKRSNKVNKNCKVTLKNIEQLPVIEWSNDDNYSCGCVDREITTSDFDFTPIGISKKEVKANKTKKAKAYNKFVDDFQDNAKLTEIRFSDPFVLTFCNAPQYAGDECSFALGENAKKVTMYIFCKYKKKTYYFKSTVKIVNDKPFKSIKIDNKEYVKKGLGTYQREKVKTNTGKHTVTWKLNKGYKLYFLPNFYGKCKLKKDNKVEVHLIQVNIKADIYTLLLLILKVINMSIV